MRDLIIALVFDTSPRAIVYFLTNAKWEILKVVPLRASDVGRLRLAVGITTGDKSQGGILAGTVSSADAYLVSGVAERNA